MVAMRPRRGEVWWVHFSPSIGSEVQKMRPAVLISNDRSNKYLDRFQVVPLTSKTDRVYPGECIVVTGKKNGKAMGNQLTTVSHKRLSKRMGILSKDDVVAVEKAIRVQLDLG